MTEVEKVNKLFLKLIISESRNFPGTGKVKNASLNQGVYIIFNQMNIVLHVGKTDRARNGLNQRLTNHLRNQSSFSKRYSTPKGIDLRLTTKFKYIEIEDPRLRTFIEALAVGKLCPAHVGTGGKK